MSIVLITGNHPRHWFLVNELSKSERVIGWIREVRESFVPEPPSDISSDLKALFRKHFALREEAEHDFFGSKMLPDLPSIEITVDKLNDEKTVAFLKKLAPKLVISYGCHKISSSVIGATGGDFWNIHGGLSPDYRGSITHFWPSYFLEPQMTGMTLHKTTDHIDGGAIIHQSSALMVKGDSLHRLAARCVHDYAVFLSTVLKNSGFRFAASGRCTENKWKDFSNKLLAT